MVETSLELGAKRSTQREVPFEDVVLQRWTIESATEFSCCSLRAHQCYDERTSRGAATYSSLPSASSSRASDRMRLTADDFLLLEWEQFGREGIKGIIEAYSASQGRW